MMQGETWLTPAQALEYGIATSITADTAAPVVQAAKKTVMQKVFQKKQEEPRADPPVPENPIMKLFERSTK